MFLIRNLCVRSHISGHTYAKLCVSLLICMLTYAYLFLTAVFSEWYDSSVKNVKGKDYNKYNSEKEIASSLLPYLVIIN